MEDTREQLTLNNPSGNEDIEKVLDIIGRSVTRITQIYDVDDVLVEYDFPKNTSQYDEWLACMGDDSMGAVVGAFNDGDDLILIANYGDEGNFEYSMLRRLSDPEEDGPDWENGPYNYRPEIIVIRTLRLG